MPAKPRTILLAVEGICPYGGIATYMRNLAEALLRRDWNVHLLVTNYRGEGYESLGPSMQCHDLSDVPLSPRKPFAAARLVDSIHPDVLLINHCSLMHYALPLLTRKTKPVSVLHNDVELFYRSAARFPEQVFRWIAPTPGLATHFDVYIPISDRRRVRVVPHGINERVFSPNGHRTGSGSQRIAFVGFIGENKGADLLPPIMAAVVRRRPDAQLTIVGYGPMQPFLADAFARLGLAGRVAFAGKLEPSGLADVMRNSDVFLLPTQVEGFGLVVVEAMLCGAVPVVSRLPGITDSIVDTDRTGFLCEPRDVPAFADKVATLLEDRQQLAEMSSAAIAAAKARFSSTTMLDAYESLFGEPDDRQRGDPCGPVGWTARTAGQVMRERIVRRWHRPAIAKPEAPPERRQCNILFVDKSRAFGGAEQNLVTTIAALDRSRFKPLVAVDFPLPHHARYAAAGAAVCARSSSGRQWWMGGDRWDRPIRGADYLSRRIHASRLRQIMQRESCDILHINLLCRVSCEDLAMARRIGIKTIGHVHSLMSQVTLTRRALELCDAVVCISKCVKDVVVQLTEAEKVTLIYDPIDKPEPLMPVEAAQGRQMLGVPAGSRVITSVAMLAPRKGHDTAIRAFAIIASEFPDVMLAIVGGAYQGNARDEIDRLKDVARLNHVESRLLFPGFVSDMRKAYAASELVLALSRDGEAFGRVSVEAAAHGRVVVATALGATPEIVVDGHTGFLVPSDVPTAAADVCRRVLSDPDLAERIGQAGKAHVDSQFAAPAILRQIESVYDRLLPH